MVRIVSREEGGRGSVGLQEAMELSLVVVGLIMVTVDVVDMEDMVISVLMAVAEFPKIMAVPVRMAVLMRTAVPALV